MNELTFRWDPKKAASNFRKHGVSFEEAQTVFYDQFARGRPDVEHDEGEDRFVLLGMSERMRVLLVVHAEAESGRVIRLISARRATRNEQKVYWEYR